eukprot:g4713.t1
MSLYLVPSVIGIHAPPRLKVAVGTIDGAGCDSKSPGVLGDFCVGDDIWGLYLKGAPLSLPTTVHRKAKRLKSSSKAAASVSSLFQLEIVLRPSVAASTYRSVAILVTDVTSSQKVQEFASALEHYRRRISTHDASGDYTSLPKLHRLVTMVENSPRSDGDDEDGGEDNERVAFRCCPFAVPYAVFKRQRDAFEFVDNKEHATRTCHALRVFSLEVGTESSSRRFIATSEEAMFQRILALSPSERHYYEIIREGYPCRLYFDLEFNTISNPDADGPLMVKRLIARVAQRLNTKYSVDVRACDFIELESSVSDMKANKKFSRHVVVHIRTNENPSKEALFRDTTEMGVFVSKMIRDDESGPKDFVLCGDQSCFVDMSVYSRNRAFRMYLCSKRGKKGALLLSADTNPFHTVDLTTWHGERRFFSDSLVCPSWVWSSSSAWRDDGDGGDAYCLLRCAADSVAASTSSIVSSYPRRVGGHPASRQSSSGTVPREAVSVAIKFCETQILSKWGPRKRGFVRAVTSYQLEDPLYALTRKMPTFLVFDILENRFCENVMREHKSNHISITMVVHRGVWFQRCHDFECRQFRSRERPLPFDVVESTVEALLGLYCGC